MQFRWYALKGFLCFIPIPILFNWFALVVVELPYIPGFQKDVGLWFAGCWFVFCFVDGSSIKLSFHIAILKLFFLIWRLLLYLTSAFSYNLVQPYLCSMHYILYLNVSAVLGSPLYQNAVLINSNKKIPVIIWNLIAITINSRYNRWYKLTSSLWFRLLLEFNWSQEMLYWLNQTQSFKQHLVTFKHCRYEIWLFWHAIPCNLVNRI